MELAALPPADVKSPPAYSVPPDTASAYTGPSIPAPRADQLLPFHCAMLLAVPARNVKSPPAYNVPPDTASANT